MNRNIYLVGAMGCYFGTDNCDYPKKWREDVKEHVKKYYEDIIITSPTDFYEFGKCHQKSEAEIMRFDLRMVREADVVLVNLKDLHSSIGTSDEIFYAFVKGKPIIGFLEDEAEMKNIHPWKLEQIDRIESGKDAIKDALDYIYNFYVDRKY